MKSTGLAECYRDHLDHVEQVMADELDHWSWESFPPMERLIRAKVLRRGKRLRPLLALALVDMLGGEYKRAYAPCAGIELYHNASLILDDIQDNSEIRSGVPTVHTTAGKATAINLAGIMRSLAYHPLHRCEGLKAEERLLIHRRLDTAAVVMFMGQTIDIGWHEGWYAWSEFPYEEMAREKTGALFGCAAWLGAFVSGADVETVQLADRLGTELGLTYQVLDDYLDVFGSAEARMRPPLEDLRGGKMSLPVAVLLDRLESQGHSVTPERVLRALAAPDARAADWRWIVDLMEELDVRGALRKDIDARVDVLTTQIDRLAAGAARPTGLDLFVRQLTGLLPTGDLDDKAR